MTRTTKAELEEELSDARHEIGKLNTHVRLVETRERLAIETHAERVSLFKEDLTYKSEALSRAQGYIDHIYDVNGIPSTERRDFTDGGGGATIPDGFTKSP